MISISSDWLPELGQFVDLRDWTLQGQGEGSLALARQANDGFELTTLVDLSDLNVRRDGQLIWEEPRLHAELTASGIAEGYQPRQLQSCLLKMVGAHDQLEAELLEPVDLRAENYSCVARVQGNGPLAAWAGRMRPWLSAVPRELSGDAYLKAKLAVGPGRVQVMESEGSVAQLQVRGDSLLIDEPRVEFSGGLLVGCQ